MAEGAIQLRPHQWREGDRRLVADFYPFVDDEPAPHLASCNRCVHYVDGEDCKPGQDPAKYPLCYPFCGPVCGHFTPSGEED